MNVRTLHPCLVLCLILSVGAISSAACSSSGGAGGDSPEALVESSVKMMEDIAGAVDSAGGDCGKMASNLEPIIKEHEGNVAKMKTMSEKMKSDPKMQEEMNKLGEKYKGRLEAAMPKMTGMVKCADDPKMKAMQEKMKGLM